VGCAGRLPEFQDHLIGVSADGRIEHAQLVRVLRIAQQVALAFEIEPGRLCAADEDQTQTKARLEGKKI